MAFRAFQPPQREPSLAAFGILLLATPNACGLLRRACTDSKELNHGFTTKIASGITKTPAGRGVERLGLLCGAQMLPSRFSIVTGGIGVGADRNYPKVVA